ncbi:MULTISPECIES: hypothetical protein [Desulfovibrio]|uniref:hypothetical protein n=1 Tax=Desulfovibrio TaxID=872 RepID=UPI0026EEF893|nr:MULTISPECIES: hypothetical protein [Desulfovibrio]MCI7617578.1 cytochrome P450 [Desulfovibrio piger]MDY4808169.1 hypothetical protein [Desulfovibrio sp.]
MPESMKILAQYMFVTLEKPLVVGGVSIPAGTTVMLAPQTTAHSVRVPGGQSLLEAWPSLSKKGHTHTDMQELLSGFQTEQISTSDRLTRLELWATEHGYDAAGTAQE